jgi:hypothetical protein
MMSWQLAGYAYTALEVVTNQSRFETAPRNQPREYPDESTYK